MADSNKRTKIDKPTCKYGSACYRKNPAHCTNFRHPSPIACNESDITESDTTDSDLSTPPTKLARKGNSQPDALIRKADDSCQDSSSISKQITTSHIKAPSSSSDDAIQSIKEKFLVEMPKDFFDLWEFSLLLSNNPTESFSDLGLHLVGPYDVLAKKISNRDIVSDNILRHWRYYYDPPEFLTVIKRDGDDCYHIGYFRDHPTEMPFGVVSNSASLGPKFKMMGDNIFAAINTEIIRALKGSDKSTKAKYQKILNDLQKLAKKLKYSLEAETRKTKARKKLIVARTFHGFGMVVPINKKTEVGYRPIPDTDARLKRILQKIASSKDDKECLLMRGPLDEIITNLHFANDEMDYGMGLELGLDLFCFGEECLHKDIQHILPLAYELLERPEFARIIKAHLSDRRKGDELSIKNH